jgi:hypothetical protein
MSVLFATGLPKCELSERSHINEVFVITILSCIQVTRREHVCACRTTFLQTSNRVYLLFSMARLV